MSAPNFLNAKTSILPTGSNHKCLIRRIVGTAASVSPGDCFIFLPTIREATNVDFLTTGRRHKNELRAFFVP